MQLVPRLNRVTLVDLVVLLLTLAFYLKGDASQDVVWAAAGNLLGSVAPKGAAASPPAAPVP